MAEWRNRACGMAGLVLPAATAGLTWIALLLAAGCATMAHGESLAEERRAQLDHGTVTQRAEALAWLAVHGDQGATHAVAQHLKDTDPSIRGLAEQTLWAIWSRSGDADVDRLMEQGVSLMNEQDYDEALSVFGEIVRRMPDFAEGYNKRATVLYLMGDYLHSLDDVEQTIRRNPEHFGALSGGGLCMLKLQRLAEALSYFDRALTVNPNMEGIRMMADQLRRAKPKPLI